MRAPVHPERIGEQAREDEEREPVAEHETGQATNHRRMIAFGPTVRRAIHEFAGQGPGPNVMVGVMQTELLVRSAQAGDADSREALARAWLPAVYGVALARKRNRASAEDLTQEAFYRACAKLRTLRNPARFGPWVLRIVRNAARDVARRDDPKLRMGSTRIASFDPPGRDEPLPGENAAVDAWRGLPEDERLICWLKVMQDLPLREIASLLGTSKSAVGRSYQRGLAKMRRELKHVRV